MIRITAAAVFLACLPIYAVDRVKPRHDSPEQLFRRAPMAQSARSIVVNFSTNLHLAFDAELCRVHTVWLGGPLNLYGPPYSNTKTPFICDFDGRRVFAFPQLSPWSAGPAEFVGMDAKEGRASFRYAVAGREISETVSGATSGNEWQITRKFDGTAGLELLVLAEAGAEAKVENEGVQVRSTHGNFELRAVGDVVWRVAREKVSYETELITDAGTEKGNPRWRFSGEETRVYARFESPGTIILGNTSSALPVQRQPGALQSFGAGKQVRRDSGDDFYRIEHFPLPPEAELMITGMDVLPNGDLAICTWLGEVYRVIGATGPVRDVRYTRVARGLNEPLGLTVRGEEMFVVQKGELTRLVDTDGDGEMDRFDCINADWGYSGNYHSYTFGPVFTPEKEIFVFVTGQRGRADLLYQGWALRIDSSGGLHQVADGLRAPHGFGLFAGDVFVTDNQGNWIGACKLNHIQPGRFYGFPSSRPSPQSPRPSDQVAPPALWLPRALSPSTSGFETISDSRFGPFQGQMVIGDFQNATLLRAFLEKVNGEWQGVVFPFARGFLSGVNRLKMNIDGKLYVGGGKRTWSTAAPSDYSLDRVSFTGKTPFDVQEVRAERDGFTLVFTTKVDREMAEDVENYLVRQFTYKYHADYGSPEFDHDGKQGATEMEVASASLADDGRTVRLLMPGLRTGYVTSFELAISSRTGDELRHSTFYYTLNQQPNED